MPLTQVLLDSLSSESCHAGGGALHAEACSETAPHTSHTSPRPWRLDVLVEGVTTTVRVVSADGVPVYAITAPIDSDERELADAMLIISSVNGR